jgi:adenylate cyclase
MLANRRSIGEDAGMDFEAKGLLDGLEGDEREARRKFLGRLAQNGFSLEQLESAVAENRLALLPLDRVFGGAHSANEIEQRTGLAAAIMTQMRRLLGLPYAEPDDKVFSDEDIDAARATKLFIDAGFDQEEIFEITRVLGEGMARLSATVTAAFTDTFLSAGDSEEEVADRFAELAQRMTPALTPVLVAAFKDHLGDSISRGVLGRAELEAGDTPASQELAVFFADLVGFTRLGFEVDPTELGTVAGKLARLATAVTQDPVRLIKTIGDAAMFVSPDPGALVQVALALVEAVEEAQLPSLRAGIAIGPALARAGDYYGNSVNLASRVTGIARPGSVLCTQEVRDAAGDDGLRWSSTGRHRLKGVSGPVQLFRARPPKPEDDGPASPKPRAGRSRRRASS